MQQYIATKVVLARPMNRQEYNDYRGWTVPDNEDPTDEGYLVEYRNGSMPNHPNHEGYISWCPKAQFEMANRLCGGPQDAPKVTPEWIHELIEQSTSEDTKLGEKTTVVQLTLPNGFAITESAACVSAENYDHEVGKSICLRRIEDRLWMLEGYRLQCELHAIRAAKP